MLSDKCSIVEISAALLASLSAVENKTRDGAQRKWTKRFD
jgi:hypothetical protein